MKKKYKITITLHSQKDDTGECGENFTVNEILILDKEPNEKIIQKMFYSGLLSIKPIKTLQYEKGWSGENISFIKLNDYKIIDIIEDNPVVPLDLDEIYKEFCELSDINNKLPYDKQERIYFDYDSGTSVENFVNFIKFKQSAVENAKVKTNYVELFVSGKLRGVYSSEEAAELDCKNSDIGTYSIFPLGTMIFTDD